VHGAGAAAAAEEAADTIAEPDDGEGTTEEGPPSNDSPDLPRQTGDVAVDRHDEADDEVGGSPDGAVPQPSWDPVDFVPDVPSSRRMPRGPVVLAIGAVALAVVVVAGIMIIPSDRGEDPVQQEVVARGNDGPVAAVEPPPEPESAPEVSSPTPVAEATASPTSPEITPGPATKVEHITWREVDGGTEVEIRTDGILDDSRVRHGWMANPPRYLLRFIGITEPYDWLQAETLLPRVPTVRIGLHADRDPPQLHVVLDLGSEAVRISAVRVEGTTVTVVLGG
jgi:hypothetical protein